MSLESDQLIQSIKTLLHSARNQIVRNVNTTIVSTYFEIGRLIIENNQKGSRRAHYGKETLKQISLSLSREFGKGFSVDNLENMRRFYITYQKSETLSPKFNLSWSHYIFLMRLPPEEREFYEIESFENNWSIRELKRQYNTALYDRLKLSKDKDSIIKLSKEGQIISRPKDIIKDPYILEFLGLKEDKSYSENDLEQAIIDKIEHFLLELGKGFAFIGRQKRFTFNEHHFFVDLVLYNRLLKCFVLIDLKIGELKHQDLGQVQMYVNYYDRFVKTKDENPTIGIILCKRKYDSIIEITLPEDNNQIFASQYQTYIPSKKEFLEQIEDIDIDE